MFWYIYVTCTMPLHTLALTLWGRDNMAPILHNHIFKFTHSSRVAHICVSKLSIVGSYNYFSPGRHQAIIWTNNDILYIGLFGTNCCEIWIEIYILSLKMHLNMSGNWRPFCLGLYLLIFMKMTQWQTCNKSLNQTPQQATQTHLSVLNGRQP